MFLDGWMWKNYSESGEPIELLKAIAVFALMMGIYGLAALVNKKIKKPNQV